MKLGIMQPYFLPYIGYWQLVHAADKFVIYDNIQYSKRGWYNRNYFLLNEDRKLFTIPLKADSDFLDVRDRYLSADSGNAIKRILAQLRFAYRRAPFYEEAFPLLESIFLLEEDNLFAYIFSSINKIKDYLGISTQLLVSSDIEVDHSLRAQEKVIAINKALRSTVYINSIGGRELYKAEAFQKEDIELLFLMPRPTEYKQFSDLFVPNLSIVDIIMFNSKDAILTMLESYDLIRGDDA